MAHLTPLGEPAPALVPWLENQSVLSGYFGLHLGLQRFIYLFIIQFSDVGSLAA
jgi:hypothetical protein